MTAAETKRVVVLDAGYLYDLVLWRMSLDAIDATGAAAPLSAFRGTLLRIDSTPKYEAHVAALKARRVVLWQGLLVELRYLGRAWEDVEMRPPAEPFWRAWTSLREQLGIEPVSVDTTGFAVEGLARSGPVDLAVVALARLHASGGAEILTIDEDVATRARELGVLPLTVPTELGA